MSSHDRKHDAKGEAKKESDQEARIRELEKRAEELGGSTRFEDSDLDPDLREAFLRNVVELEEAGWSRPGDLLKQGGVEITPSDHVSDEEFCPRSSAIGCMRWRFTTCSSSVPIT